MKRILALILLLALAACSYAEDYVPGDVIVVLRNTSAMSISAAAKSSGGVRGLSSVQSFAQSEGVNVARTFDALSELGGKVFMVVHSDKEDAKSLLRRISANPNVLAASLNRIYHGHADSSDRRVPDDPEYYRLWGMEAIHAPQAWSLSTGSNDVYVAVLDSGIDYNHPDLAAHFVHEYSKNFVQGTKYNEKSYYDEVNHGTHVAGTIGAIANNGLGVAGVNWNVKLISVRVLDADNSGTDESITAGLNHVADLLRIYPEMKLAAVNYSIGGGWEQTPGEIIAQRNPQYLAFKTISDTNRTLICVSAGNESAEVGAPNYFGDMSRLTQGLYVYPASFTGIDNMIVVAAAAPDFTRAGFSNYSRKYADITAPGLDIFSTVGRSVLINLVYDTLLPSYPYSYMSGTSMAAPHVSGTAALLKAMYPQATASQIKAAIVGGADTRTLVDDGTSMYGMLDISGAILGMDNMMKSDSAPIIAFAALPAAVVNQPYNFRFYASGAGRISWDIDGVLPAGLRFDSGIISGTPLSVDRREILVTAMNDYGQDSLALVISTDRGTAPEIRSAVIPATAAGKNTGCYVKLSAGTWPFSWEITNSADIIADGALVSVDKAGYISFTPEKAGSYTITVKVSNFAGSDSIDIPATVNSGDGIPFIYDTVLKPAVVGKLYGAATSADFQETYNINPRNVNPDAMIYIDSWANYHWSANNVPEGMYFTNADSGIRLSGYPSSADTYIIHVTASNDYGTASRDFELVVINAAPSFLEGKYDMTYPRGMNMDLRIPVLGTPDLSVDISGTVPAGISFDMENYTARFAGFPSAKGVYSSVITATNQYGTSSADVTITITDPAIITTAVLPESVVGESYGFKLGSLFGASLSWSESGDVLSGIGLSLSASGDITGTPTRPGDYRFTVRASALDSWLNDTWNYLLRVSAKTEITAAATLPSGKINTPYEPVYIACYGSAPMWFTLTEGAMPAGLSLTSNGCIYGTPTESGTFIFTVTASNLAGDDSRTFTVTIAADGTSPASPDVKPASPDVKPSPASPDIKPSPVTPEVKPALTAGESRGVSAMTAGEIAEILQENGIIAAVLPEIRVNVSGVYSFESVDALANVTLSPDVPAGYTLHLYPFTRDTAGSLIEDSEGESATFYDISGNVIDTVPENHIVNISAYFEAGKTYYPAISAVSPSDSVIGVGGGSGGCVAGASVLGLMLCAVIFRKNSR